MGVGVGGGGYNVYESEVRKAITKEWEGGGLTYQGSDDEIDGIAGNTISDYQISEKGSQTGNQKLEVKQKENKKGRSERLMRERSTLFEL